jgi:antirestriction protein ArdC
MGRATRKKPPSGNGSGGGRKSSSKGGGKKKKSFESVSRQIVADLLEAVRESGELPWTRPWNVGAGPRNGLTGRPYRGINTFYLDLVARHRGYTSNRWMTYPQAQEASFRQWCKEQGLSQDDPESRKKYEADPDAYRGVRRGESAVQVVARFWVDKKDRQGNLVLGADGKPIRIQLRRYYNVYNADQTDLEFPPEDVEERTEVQQIEAAEEVIAGYPGGPQIEHGGNAACYIPSQDLIRMPPRERFHSDEQYYHTLFHEMIHSTGHPSRTNRTKGDWGGMGSDSYAEEELVAEIGAAMLSGHVGTQSSEDMRRDSAPYLAGWMKRLEEDPEMFVRAATRAHTAVDYILDTQFD